MTGLGLLALPPDELSARARSVRDASTGTRITYSPKVFIPLTMLCRDRCGYCTFARPPARLQAPYLSPEEVLAIARRGAEAGCHEALFTLGERPEERYPAARQWLAGGRPGIPPFRGGMVYEEKPCQRHGGSTTLSSGRGR